MWDGIDSVRASGIVCRTPRAIPPNHRCREETEAMAKDHVYKPYVDPKSTMKELTVPPLILGALMAIVLGAANVYLGLKAGMTVAATFPAAVISMAVLRIFKCNILEENIARTTGAVGEALAAGAIFTVPAFVIVGVWDNLDIFSANWLLATALLAVGGVLGVLFVILLRRTFVEDASLPFPESAGLHRDRQGRAGGQSGAGTVFGSMGLAGLLEFFKNSAGIPIIGGPVQVGLPAGQGRLPAAHPQPLAGVPGRGLHHRPQVRRHHRLGRRLRLAVPDAHRALHDVGAGRRLRRHHLSALVSRRQLGRALRRRREGGFVGLKTHLRRQHQDDRHRRHDRGRLLHPLQDAHQPGRRASSAASPRCGGGEQGRRPRSCAPTRT